MNTHEPIAQREPQGGSLAMISRHGPLLLFVGTGLSLAWPDLAAAARPWMTHGVFLCTVGSFLQIRRGAFAGLWGRPGLLVTVMTWTLLGVPLVAWLLLRLLPLPRDLEAGMLLYAMAPPAAGAAAMAAMLGLNTVLALVARAFVGLLAPVYLPLLATWLTGISLPMGMLALAWPVAVVMLGGAAVAQGLRRLPCAHEAHREQAGSAVSLIGLLLVFCGAMQGVPDYLMHRSGEAAAALACAFAISIVLQAIGSVVFAPLGRSDALTVGLISGQRNTSLIWVAMTPWLAADSSLSLFFAISIVPSFTLPLLMDIAQRRWLACRCAAAC